ncbi:hypothetical protein BD324DRAFT_678025 [Kockovaella imperatae]|uniref:BTB domain-containing protein n=1 Tax=Kockovaella imperatae TaxID=4999 RepID=A0A1Y1UR67_9TREE|nr:hypothetical protein BD324DRAFT_678025 [Kockovaella imperatae]ORX40571.1 hypothetical protein BD324DRAFT_678025 [Kockovaella imperatae]
MTNPSNPSHRLLSRRSPAHPQLAPTSTARHSPSASLPPSIGTWTYTHATRSAEDLRRSFNDDEHGSLLEHQSGEVNEEEETVEVHETFQPGSALPGRVKVIVGRYHFWCHKEVLWFASPFFQCLLQGSWAETSRKTPPGSTIPSRRASNVQSPPDTDRPHLPLVREHTEEAAHVQYVKSLSNEPEDPTTPIESGFHTPALGENEDEDAKKASIYLDAAEDNPSMTEILRELREIPDPANRNSTAQLEHPIRPLTPPGQQTESIVTARKAPRSPRKRSRTRHSFSSASIHRPAPLTDEDTSQISVEAVVELHEESAAAFQDFLFWCYPHLDCKVTWTNVEDLLALSLKLLTPALQKLCERFLMTHASGRPVMALMLAEMHNNGELYREASRFVLDQPTWAPEEMDMLSEITQLKLSKRRNWFLERLLKLGSIDVKKEYTCRPDCPDPARCQATLDEKWRQAHSAVSRYGPPQPSVAFRCLRQLEVFPTNPSLVMPHPSCQSAAKSWVTSLFDRMFQPKMAFVPHNPGTEKYWLWITIT